MPIAYLPNIGANKMSNGRDALVGIWQADSRDDATLKTYGNVTLKFDTEGKLRYTIHGNGKDEISLLTYHLESGFIVTNQPSHPKLERTAYELTPDGQLILHLEGQRSIFRRIV